MSDQNAKPELANKIGFFPHADTGCYWYRIKIPMDALKRAGFDVERVEWEKPLDFPNFQSFQMYGIQGTSMKQIAEFITREGKKFVFDIDDAMNHISPDNIHYHAVKYDTYTVTELMDAASEVTVTTELLKANFAALTKTPISVLPNCYNPDEWMERPRKQKKLRIGFSGGPSHIADLNIILPIIAKLQKKFDFTFVLYGIGPLLDYQESFKHLADRGTPELLAELSQFDKNLQGITFEWVPFVHWLKHPACLASLDLDIGLCPLKNTPFNQCKSAIKAMEYNLTGSLAVASNVPPFSEEPTSILVSNDKWEKALTDIIKHWNSQALVEQQNKHLTWLKENRNVNNENILEILKKIYVK